MKHLTVFGVALGVLLLLASCGFSKAGFEGDVDTVQVYEHDVLQLKFTGSGLFGRFSQTDYITGNYYKWTIEQGFPYWQGLGTESGPLEVPFNTSQNWVLPTTPPGTGWALVRASQIGIGVRREIRAAGDYTERTTSILAGSPLQVVVWSKFPSSFVGGENKWEWYSENYEKVIVEIYNNEPLSGGRTFTNIQVTLSASPSLITFTQNPASISSLTPQESTTVTVNYKGSTVFDDYQRVTVTANVTCAEGESSSDTFLLDLFARPEFSYEVLSSTATGAEVRITKLNSALGIKKYWFAIGWPERTWLDGQEVANGRYAVVLDAWEKGESHTYKVVYDKGYGGKEAKFNIAYTDNLFYCRREDGSLAWGEKDWYYFGVNEGVKIGTVGSAPGGGFVIPDWIWIMIALLIVIGIVAYVAKKYREAKRKK